MIRLSRYFTMFVCLLHVQVICASSSNIHTKPPSLTFQHHPINPGCLAIINSSEADRYFVKKIDLTRCQTGNSTANWDRKGTGINLGNGYYRYDVIGRTDNGIFVIKTTLRTGGTGVFQSLLLVRLQRELQFEWNPKNQKFTRTPYTALKILADIIGGDRFTGSFKQLKVEHNRIVGWRYSSSNTPSESSQNNKKVIMDLSQL